MNDCIIIDNLVAFANHGVLPEEKKMGQKFLISLKLFTDMYPAAKDDDLTKSVDYGEVSSFVTEFTQKNRCKLIESAAMSIADELLIRYFAIKKVEITLKKPWAPIGLPVDSVAVKMTRTKHKVYLGIGSNLGNKKEYLDFAVSELNRDRKCTVKKVSDYIETDPVGDVEQDMFLNGCLEIETLYSPHELLDVINKIEHDAGRERKIHWGPRTLDIDILLYDDLMIFDDRLKIPHIEMTKREFVLEPLSQIAPYIKHPITNECVITLLERLRNNNGNA